MKEPLAIVGIGCRFPGGANNPDLLWKLLADGVDAISEVPSGRWHMPTFYHPDPSKPGRTYARWGGFLEDVDHFDAQFFGISPREAAKADPQQRLLLEVAYEALEDAGLPPDQIAGTSTGVFVGISTYDYGGMQSSLSERGGIDAYTNMGAALCIAANRISYLFDLHGPSLAVDTACSSSLVAVHLACQSIWSGESELAFIGGVNLMLRPEGSIGFSKASMLSRDGRCKSFDAGANGYVRAEGVGVVLVRPLSSALSRGDTIYAVIRATTVNQDGRTSGISMPNEKAQEEMLREALSQAGLSPNDVQYVEAHGTGTTVGDPIEATAIGHVLGGTRSEGEYCRIGSIKTNIGHAEAASGIAGLIKTVLCLQHAQIPANLHYESPNPQIPFEDLHLRVVQHFEMWPDTNGQPRRAGVNSFGFGGTNAHVILESAPERTTVPSLVIPNHNQDRAQLLPLSARSEEALAALAGAYCDLLVSDGLSAQASLRDICCSASMKRGHHDHRLAVVAHDKKEAVEQLRAFLEGETRATMSAGRSFQSRLPQPVFVCSGMGQQWWGMTRELLTEESVYRETVERIDSVFAPQSGWSILDELMRSEDESRLHQTSIAQPAIFSMQVGLAALWRSWGIEPSAVTGHSVGEVAAAHIAGALTLEDAVTVIFHRSRLQQRTAGRGGMLSVGLSREDAELLTAGKEADVSVAAINSPRSVTLTGDRATLEGIASVLNDRSVFCRFLAVDVPYHSSLMDPLREEFLECLNGLSPTLASIPLFSTLTGEAVTGSELDAEYWWRNIRNPVQFQAAIEKLTPIEHALFLEIGAHPVLAASISECLTESKRQGTVLPSLRRTEPERSVMLGTLGRLYTIGTDIDWRKLYPEGGPAVKLPPYTWQREKHWHESEQSRRDRLGEKVHPLLGARLASPLASWEVELDPLILSYLGDHQIQESIIFPAAGYVEMALAAAEEVFGDTPCVLDDFVFRKGLFLTESDPPQAQVALDATQSSFEIQSRNGSSTWSLHAAGKLRQLNSTPAVRETLSEIRERCINSIKGDECYRRFARIGLNYGPMFQGIEQLWMGPNEALGEIRIPECLADQLEQYRMHPALLDSCFQVLLGTIYDGERLAAAGLYLPVKAEQIIYRDSPGPFVMAHARLVKRTPTELVGDIRLLDEEGNCQAEIRGFVCRAVERSLGSLQSSLYEYVWKLLPRPDNVNQARVSDHLPVASRLVHNLRRRAEDLKVRLRRDRYYQVFLPSAHQLAATYIIRGLQKIGWNPHQHSKTPTAVVCEQLGIVPEHRRLFARLIEGLKTEDLAVDRDAQTLFQKLWQQFPDAQAELILMRECGENLSDVLLGKADPLNLIFPQGSDAIAEHLYQDSPTFRIYNLLVQKAIEEITSNLPEGRTLRVLEIGGGTAGMTAYVLPVLSPNRTQYVFTDVAPLLVTQAQQKLREYPFVEFGTLDIEGEPEKQPFEPHSFDLILASDVLHATRDLRHTIEQVRQLMGSKAMLVLLEGTRAPLGVILVFGMLKGWWLFEDHDIREADAWIEPKVWQNLLQDAGFTDTEFITDSEDVPNAVHSVILARGPELTPTLVDALPPSTTEDQSVWLIFADSGANDQPSAGLELAAEIRKRGDQAIVVTLGDQFQQLEDGSYEVCAREDLQRVVAAVSESAVKWRGVAYLWALDAAIDEDTYEAFDLSSIKPLHLVQALGALDHKEMPTLWLITRGVHYVAGSGGDVEVSQSPLWGLGRVVMNEYQGLRCRLVDLGTHANHRNEVNQFDSSSKEIQSLTEEMYAGLDDDEISLRGEARYVHRLVHTSPAKVRRTGSDLPRPAFQLAPEIPGVLESLIPYPLTRRSPAHNEVEIEIHATGLNFKDVILAMGLLPEEAAESGLSARTLGMECAGIIVAVGQGVSEFKVGDEVLACGPGALATHLTIDARFVVRKPNHLTFEEGATVPIAFLTAYYSLHVLGELQSRERVLLHAATGGVGLAALQLAQQAGAEVFATAGSQIKRRLLETLGVPHVMDSRTLTFADEILALTAGEGVDVVLNSLSGQAIPKSLSVLRPFGRFLEIGKRDIYEDSKIGLRPFSKNISFYAVALDRLCDQRTELAQSLLGDVMKLFEDQQVFPLSHRTVPAVRAGNAFRAMAQARHIGKVVVSIADREGVVPVREGVSMPFHADRTYLITGGLGGFGLAAAEWLVRNGARHLLLIGRAGAASARAQAAVTALQASANIVVRTADVTDLDQVRDVIEFAQQSLPPLAGVIHAAMVLDDAQCQDLNEARMMKVIGPKALGAWNLHTLTAAIPLDFFVLFSSFTTVIGNAGQANYVAGNAFLDALSWHRRLRGLPALTVNWGGVSDVGYLADNPDVAKRVEQLLGVKSMPSTLMLDTLGELLAADAVQVGLAQLDWHRTAQLFGSRMPQRFCEVRGSSSGGEEAAVGDAAIQAVLDADPAERKPLLESFLRDHLAKVLGISPKKVDINQPLPSLGLDSLMAMEMRTRVQMALGVDVPPVKFLEGISISGMATFVTEQLALADSGSTRQQVAPANISEMPSIDLNTSPVASDSAELLARIEQLTDEEVDQHLRQRMAHFGGN